MVKEPPRLCSCCGKVVDARTERRHQAGQGPPRVRAMAAQAASKVAKTAAHAAKTSIKKGVKRVKKAVSVGKAVLRAASPVFQGGMEREDVEMLDETGDMEVGLEMERDVDETVIDEVQHVAWSGRDRDRYRVTVEEVDDEDDHRFDRHNIDSDSEYDEGTSSEDNSEDENGMVLEDWVDEDWERELAQYGEEFTDDDIEILRAFTLKTEDHLTDKTFERLRFTFPKSNISSFKATKARVEFLAAFKPVPYDCCVNSCCCFVGPHEKEEACPYCKEARFKDGRPRRRFTYIPLIPRLLAFFKNQEMVELMSYRNAYKPEDDKTRDVFDSDNYLKLKRTDVTVGEKQLKFKFFSGSRDLALGFSSDGFAPFKKRKQSCWPIIVFNYNLPPEIRFLIRNVLCVGVVPGPNKPKDFDSFLWPLVEEALKLILGITAFDVTREELFKLHAYFILGFGDMPAIAMIMRMKGHNGLFPCRMCNIKGIRVPGASGPTLHVPLDRSHHPSCQATEEIKKYDPANLPLRTHEQFLENANHVQFAPTTAEEERHAKACGIKGIPLLSHLSSLFFPSSFPFDFMHLIFENLIKNLVLLWTGKFKDLDEGSGSYELAPNVWEAIGEATAASGSTIPSVYGARPQNVAQDKSACTADSWSFWALYLGPVLLQNRFRSSVYYEHFVKLVKLITLCLQFEISKKDITTIREGFIEWVSNYEKLYYQYSPDRLSACPVTIHALLHIADGIEAAGPVWAYWAFPMERFCGLLLPCIKSHRFPYANIDSHVIATAQISQIKNRYGLQKELSLNPPHKEVRRGALALPAYPTCVLLCPRVSNPDISPGLANKIIVCLSTRYGKSVTVARRNLDLDNVELWGKVQRLDGGDIMKASALVKSQEDRRDASYVRYELLVDANARRRTMRPRFVPTAFYGQLQHIFVVQVPVSEELGTTAPETLILGAILTCKITESNELDMHFYESHGRTEVVDISTIQCLVGRFEDRKRWVIIDRSGNLARATFNVDQD